MSKKSKREDRFCKACLFYDSCDYRVLGGCFSPIDTDGDLEVEKLIEDNRMSYRAEYFSFLEHIADDGFNF